MTRAVRIGCLDERRESRDGKKDGD